jgi:hypothetical protein
VAALQRLYDDLTHAAILFEPFLDTAAAEKIVLSVAEGAADLEPDDVSDDVEP